MERFMSSIDQLSKDKQGKLRGGFVAVFAGTNTATCTNEGTCDDTSNADFCTNEQQCKNSSNDVCTNSVTCFY